MDAVGATNVREDSALPRTFTSKTVHGRPQHRTRYRVLTGIAAGASAGAITGLTMWAFRTVPVTAMCDFDNSKRGFIAGDTGPQPCNRHAERRAHYTWTGVILGGATGGIIGRLTRDAAPDSRRVDSIKKAFVKH